MRAKNTNMVQTRCHEVKVFLTDEENLEYEAFLRPFGGKKGPYAKAILFKHIREHRNSFIGERKDEA